MFLFGKKKDKEKDASDLLASKSTDQEQKDPKEKPAEKSGKPYRPSESVNPMQAKQLHTPKRKLSAPKEPEPSLDSDGEKKAREAVAELTQKLKALNSPSEGAEKLSKASDTDEQANALAQDNTPENGSKSAETANETDASTESVSQVEKLADEKHDVSTNGEENTQQEKLSKDSESVTANTEADKDEKAEVQKQVNDKSAVEVKSDNKQDNSSTSESETQLKPSNQQETSAKTEANKQTEQEKSSKTDVSTQSSTKQDNKNSGIGSRWNWGSGNKNNQKQKAETKPRTLLQDAAPLNGNASKDNKAASSDSQNGQTAPNAPETAKESKSESLKDDKKREVKPAESNKPEQPISGNIESDKSDHSKDNAAQQQKQETKTVEQNEASNASQKSSSSKTLDGGKILAAQTESKKTEASEKQKYSRKQVAQPVLISFVCNGKKIAKDFAFVGEPGKKLTLEDLPKISGYIVKDELLPDVEISAERKSVTINYRPSTVTYQIIPVNEDLTPIKSTAEYKHYRGRSGSLIELFPQIKGYRQATTRSYYVPEENGKKIKVVYTPLRQTIRVIHRAENGEVLTEEHISGKTGEKYSVKLNSYHFSGYELGEVPNNLSGTFSPDSPEVVISYVPANSSVLVEFVDESGNQIHKPLEEKGKFKSEYAIQLPIIDGYELASDPNMLNGRFSAKQRKIVLQFKPAPTSFMVHYWLDSEKTMHAVEDKEVSGLVGDRYLVETPELQGMKPDKELVEGIFSAYENPDVDVVFTEIPCTITISFRATNGEQINGYNPKEFKGRWGEELEFELPDIKGYRKTEDTYKTKFAAPTFADSVYYKPIESGVRVRYINARTNEEITTVSQRVVKGLVGSAYSIEPEIIDGFHLSKVPDSASGIYTPKEQRIDFLYEPNLSELVLHYYDSTLNSLAPNTSLKGYYGEKYQIDPGTALTGYKLTNSSYPLEGTFPPNRQDVDLYFKAAQVSFDLIPVNQYGEEIDEKYNIHVTGLINQTFSERPPEIPGYTAKYNSIEASIKQEYADKRLKLAYDPKDTAITVHCFYDGGNHDGERVFEDETFTGKVGSEFRYPVKEVDGYTANMQLLAMKFAPHKQDITVIYEVRTEDYLIHYKDPQGTMVGGMPQAKGYYGQAIDVSGNIPKGFHMLSGADSKIYLDGSGVYNVAVRPNELLVDVIPQTADGVNLMSPRQVVGEYHIPQEITLPSIPGFNSTVGSTITVPFELDETTLPVVYEPQLRKITVRYISVEGDDIHEPTVEEGRYEEHYEIKPLQIDGYFVLKDEPKTGIYGLTDANVTFVYRAGSDEFSRAVTPLSEIIQQQDSIGEEPSDTSPAPQKEYAAVVSVNADPEEVQEQQEEFNGQVEIPAEEAYIEPEVQVPENDMPEPIKPTKPVTASNPNSLTDLSGLLEEQEPEEDTELSDNTSSVLDFLDDDQY